MLDRHGPDSPNAARTPRAGAYVRSALERVTGRLDRAEPRLSAMV